MPGCTVGLKNKTPKMTFLKVEPKWNNLPDDLRFQDLLRRMGFEHNSSRKNGRSGDLNVERATGIEPATSGLGSRHSTIELRPLGQG